MSKVPNCKDIKIKSKDTPGPGFYENIRSSDGNGGNNHMKANSDAGVS